MGCSSSHMSTPTVTVDHAPGHTDGNAFTDSQKRRILRTWKILSNDLNGRGVRIFLRIFQQNPHVQKIFSFKDMSHEDLTKDATFKGHASRFMQAVGAVIDNIDDYEQALAPLLNGLGRQHIHYVGFKYDYFDAFTESMAHIWTEDLGSKFDDDTREAWMRVFNFIMSELKGGYQDALKDAGLERPAWQDEEGGVIEEVDELLDETGDDEIEELQVSSKSDHKRGGTHLKVG